MAWSVLLNVVNAIYGFVSVPLLLKYFGKGEYGLISLALSVNVYMQLMDMGLNSTNVRFFSNWLAKGESYKVKSGFGVSLIFYGVVGLINAMVLLLVALFSDSIFKLTPEQNIIIKHLFYILAVSAIVSWYSSSFDQLISATENIAWIRKRSFLPKGIQILVLILTLTCHFNIETYFFFTTFGLFAIIPLSIRKIRKILPFISFRPKWDKLRFKEIFPYSVNIFSFSIFQFSFWKLRPVILGIQGTPEMVADFSIMSGIIGMIGMVTGPILGVLLPSSSKVVALNDTERYYQIAYDGVKYVSIVICLFCFGLISIAPDLLVLYVGKSYLYLVPWLTFWAVLSITGYADPISSLVFAGSKIRPLTYSSIVASISGLCVSWFLVPIYDVGGVIFGHLVYTCVQQTFYWFYYWPKTLKISSRKIVTESLAPYVLMGVLALVIVHFSPSQNGSFLNLLRSGTEFSVVYLLIVILTLKKKDRMFFARLIRKVK